MHIPDKIKLGAHTINIEQVQNRDISSAGEYYDYDNLIRLRVTDQPETSVAECFMHEIIEGIKVKYELSIDHCHLTVLSEALFQVIRDNQLSFEHANLLEDISSLDKIK